MSDSEVSGVTVGSLGCHRWRRAARSPATGHRHRPTERSAAAAVGGDRRPPRSANAPTPTSTEPGK